MKQKKCKQCGKAFSPINSLQPVCSYLCALKYNSKKEVDKRIRNLKKGLQTQSDHIQALQIVFNTYIRLRDKGKKCISCDEWLLGKYDAGHYYSAGNYSFLRFNEDNVHGQCVHCNQHLHGNLIEYSKKLEKRIGKERYNELETNRHRKLLLPKEEILELITKYKLKIKGLK